MTQCWALLLALIPLDWLFNFNEAVNGLPFTNKIRGAAGMVLLFSKIHEYFK